MSHTQLAHAIEWSKQSLHALIFVDCVQTQYVSWCILYVSWCWCILYVSWCIMCHGVGVYYMCHGVWCVMVYVICVMLYNVSCCIMCHGVCYSQRAPVQGWDKGLTLALYAWILRWTVAARWAMTAVSCSSLTGRALEGPNATWEL